MVERSEERGRVHVRAKPECGEPRAELDAGHEAVAVVVEEHKRLVKTPQTSRGVSGVRGRGAGTARTRGAPERCDVSNVMSRDVSNVMSRDSSYCGAGRT